MIKFVFKKSLIYLSVYKIIYYLRIVEVVLMKYKFSFNSPIVQIFLMGLGEMIGGLSVYLFINKAFKKKKIKQYLGIQLIKHEFKEVKLDGWIKIIILIFFEGYFDFLEAVILFPSIVSDKSISSTINHRFSIITTIVSSLLYTYLLKYKIGKHQKFILVAISIVFILLLIIEVIFNTEYTTFFIVLILNILSSLFIIFMDIIERYLGDNDFPNPFGILAGEGSVVIILTSIYSIGKNPFGQLKQFYEFILLGVPINITIIVISSLSLSSLSQFLFALFKRELHAPFGSPLLKKGLTILITSYGLIISHRPSEPKTKYLHVESIFFSIMSGSEIIPTFSPTKSPILLVKLNPGYVLPFIYTLSRPSYSPSSS